MTNTSATVVTLTAEVRVLQVGNRQVTLSVVKQLDRARYGDIDPMGRVRSGRKIDRLYCPAEDEQEIEIVGRLRATGALVIVFAPAITYLSPPDSWDHWAGHRICTGEFRKDSLIPVMEENGKAMQWYTPWRDSAEDCPLRNENPHEQSWTGNRAHDDMSRWLFYEWEHHQRVGDFCNMAALEQQWRAALPGHFAEYLAQEKTVSEAESLPLIVLAGLK